MQNDRAESAAPWLPTGSRSCLVSHDALESKIQEGASAKFSAQSHASEVPLTKKLNFQAVIKLSASAAALDPVDDGSTCGRRGRLGSAALAVLDHSLKVCLFALVTA